MQTSIIVKLILGLIGVCFCTNSIAQNNANWVFGDSMGVDFRYSPPKLFKTHSRGHSSFTCASNEKGELIMYSDRYNMFDNNHNIIKNNFPQFIGGASGANAYLIKQPGINDFYYLFKAVYDTSLKKDNYSIRYWKIKFQSDSNKYSVIEECKYIDTCYPILSYLQHTNKKDFWLIWWRNDTTLMSMLFNSNGINVPVENKITDLNPYLDKFPYKKYFIAEPCHNLPYIYKINSIIKVQSITTSSFIEAVHQLERIEINKTNGIVKKNLLMFSDIFKKATDYNDVNSMAISERDSIVYYSVSLNSTLKSYLVQLYLQDVNKTTVNKFFYSFNHNSYTLKIGSDGILYLGKHTYNFYGGRIFYPDLVGKRMLFDSINIYPKLQPFRSLALVSYPSVFLPYHKLFILPSNTCDKLGMGFKVDYDSSFFTKFKWYFHLNGDSLMDSLDGNNVKFAFPKSGEYKVRLAAKSDAGFTQWKETIVRYRKPPEADFDADRHYYCLGKISYFTSKCKNDTMFGIKPQSWLWSFGDSNSSTQENPSHTYSKVGVYHAKLIYSSGYCIDSITKKNIIEIQDQPKANFNFSFDSKCIPSKLDFKNTSLGAINAWKYSIIREDSLYKDSLLISSGYFVVKNSGKYNLKLDVIGLSGCKDTITKSVRFNNAISINDTPKFNFVQVDSLNHILINWQKIRGAKQYVLNRNKINLPPIIDTFFYDSIADYKRINNYILQGFDSCNRKSAASKNISNIFLSTSSNFNSGNILNWNLPNNDYFTGFIYSKIDSFNFMNQLNYLDESYYQLKNPYPINCYKIKYFNKLNSNYVSTSNISCQDIPFITFIPNSITPDNDGLNDEFYPKCFGVESYSLKIVNSWGQIVYNSIHNSEKFPSWKPHLNTPLGVYIYLINFSLPNGDQIFRMGNITIIKK